MVEIAKEVTGTNDSDEAVRLFRQKLNSTDSFFNDASIPKNESNKEAHKKCSSLQGAEKHCPTRWAAMQLWFKEARRVSFLLQFYKNGTTWHASLLAPFFLLFLARFFPFARYLLSFISMAKVFLKAFRIVGLDGRKCRRVVGKHFMGIFGSILHGFWPFSVASLTEPCSFWYDLKDLSPLHYPGYQRLFKRAFRVRSSLKK